MDSPEINIKSQDDIKPKALRFNAVLPLRILQIIFAPDTGKIDVYQTSSGFLLVSVWMVAMALLVQKLRLTMTVCWLK